LDHDYAAALARLEQLIASPVSQDGGPTQASQEAWRLQGECLFQLGDMDRALHSLNTAMSFEKKFEEPAVFIRLGSVLVAKKRWKQAREAYLRSIQLLPTAEAWGGVAYAEYRSDELQMCYEALCEANLLDNERPDVWALLTLVHLRLENFMQADHSFRQCLKLNPDCEELLLEVASEYAKGASGQCQHSAFAEVSARKAMSLRDSGQSHCSLAEALFVQGQVEHAVLEAQVAMKLLIDQPETRKAMFDRALRWCEELGDVAITEALHAVQQRCDQEAAKSP
jgi:tetratricopeptide (TPR) repeat protein